MTDKELREQAEKVWDNAFNNFLTQPGSMEKLRDDAVFALAAALEDVYREGVKELLSKARSLQDSKLLDALRLEKEAARLLEGARHE